jgi:hypothetical protein
MTTRSKVPLVPLMDLKLLVFDLMLLQYSLPHAVTVQYSIQDTVYGEVLREVTKTEDSYIIEIFEFQ